MRSLNFKRQIAYIVTLFTAGMMMATLSPAKDSPNAQYANDPIIARVDKEPIRISDVEDKQTNDLRQQLFEILDSQLKKAAVEKLGKKHKEYADIPKFQVNDNEIKDMYDINGLSAKGSYQQFYPMIKKYLENKKEMDHIELLYAKAVDAGLIESYLESPKEFLVKVPVETAYLRGNKKAGVMFLEFSDYQCPFCSRVQPTISMLRERYKNDVVFGYRHSPLPFHREADEAAIAAECARDQGKFIEYHNLLFQNQRNQFPDDLKLYAKKVNVKNLDKFDKCLDQEKYRPRLDRDLEVASDAGIRGTPGFIIGRYDPKTDTVSGEIISGAQPQAVFTQAIEKFLKK